MNSNHRLRLLNMFNAAGDRGLTMRESGYRFTATDIANLNGTVERIDGPSGAYRITQAGKDYLAVREQGAAA